MLDTAAYYDNEEAVGRGHRVHLALIGPDIIVTTKIWHTDAGYDATMRAVESCSKEIRY